MNTIKRAIIHIGAHKTGSTSIQKWLTENSSNLASEGIFYPLELTNPQISFYGQHVIPWNLLGWSDQGLGVGKKLIDSGLKELENFIHEKDTLLLSSEDFVWLKDSHICKLKEVLNGYKIDVVIYVRRQDEATQALYQTDVLYYHQTQMFSDWLQPRIDAFDYFAICERWRTQAQAQIIVRPYDLIRQQEGDVVRDFLEVISGIVRRPLALDSPTRRPALNPTLPDFVVNMARYYNARPSADRVIPALKRLGLSIKIASPDKELELAEPSLRRRILGSFRDSNLKLCKRYLNSEGAIWFDETVVGSDDEWVKQHNFEGSELVALAEALTEAISNSRMVNAVDDETQSRGIPRAWQTIDAFQELQIRARRLTPDQWIETVGEACERPTVLDAFALPQAPAAATQAVFVGSSGRTALNEAGKFYKLVLNVLEEERMLRPKSLLDFGCGWGRYTRLFARDVTDGGLYGTDPWTYAINLCRAYFPFANFSQCGFFPPLHYRENFFDVVIAYSVFSHLSELTAGAWIVELARVLKPGGILVATTHGPWLFDKVDDIRSGRKLPFNEWEKGLARNWPPLEPLREQYFNGSFIFLQNLSDADLPRDLYGNAFVPEGYVRGIWERHLECIKYISDPEVVSQAVFVMRKKIKF